MGSEIHEFCDAVGRTQRFLVVHAPDKLKVLPKDGEPQGFFHWGVRFVEAGFEVLPLLPLKVNSQSRGC